MSENQNIQELKARALEDAAMEYSNLRGAIARLVNVAQDAEQRVEDFGMPALVGLDGAAADVKMYRLRAELAIKTARMLGAKPEEALAAIKGE